MGSLAEDPAFADGACPFRIKAIVRRPGAQVTTLFFLSFDGVPYRFGFLSICSRMPADAADSIRPMPRMAFHRADRTCPERGS